MLDIEAYATKIEDRRVAVAGVVGTSAWFLVGVIASYLLFVFVLGRNFMAKHAPFKLTRVLVAYNLLQVLANAYYVRWMIRIFSHEESNFWCQPLFSDRTDTHPMDAFYATYFFYSLKVFDLLDTVFFVLRKKWNQVTFLHVYHHIATLCILWTAVRVYPGGSPFVTALFNAMVHCIMYSYYLMAALHLPGVFIIKPFITTVQLAQFVVNVCHLALSTAFGSCESARIFQCTIVAVNTSFFLLFVRFYRNEYSNRTAGHKGFALKGL